MKVLVAFAGIALVAVLTVSATMGAETLVPGGDSAEKQGLPTAASGKARLRPTGKGMRGTGFVPGENVRVTVLEALPGKVTRRVTADANGTFVVRLNAAVDRCNGYTVTAVGDKGSRASYRPPQLLCPMSGARP